MDDNVLDITINNVEVELEAEDVVRIDNSGAGKSPYIGENGNWYEYDDQNKIFIDTGIQAEGPEGPEGPAGVELPTITASDAGKVLTVNSSGAWVAASLPLYNGGVS